MFGPGNVVLFFSELIQASEHLSLEGLAALQPYRYL